MVKNDYTNKRVPGFFRGLSITIMEGADPIKINAIFSELQKDNLIIQETIGKYRLIGKSETIIKEIEQFDKKYNNEGWNKIWLQILRKKY